MVYVYALHDRRVLFFLPFSMGPLSCHPQVLDRVMLRYSPNSSDRNCGPSSDFIVRGHPCRLNISSRLSNTFSVVVERSTLYTVHCCIGYSSLPRPVSNVQRVVVLVYPRLHLAMVHVVGSLVGDVLVGPVDNHGILCSIFPQPCLCRATIPYTSMLVWSLLCPHVPRGLTLALAVGDCAR